jgi:hypothetical protein
VFSSVVVQLAEYLQAPVPFVMGMPTSFLFTRGVPEALVTAVVVHLDTDTVCGMRGVVSPPDGPWLCVVRPWGAVSGLLGVVVGFFFVLIELIP